MYRKLKLRSLKSNVTYKKIDGKRFSSTTIKKEEQLNNQKESSLQEDQHHKTKG